MTNEERARLFTQLARNELFASWVTSELNTVAMALTSAAEVDTVRTLQGKAQLLKSIQTELERASMGTNSRTTR